MPKLSMSDAQIIIKAIPCKVNQVYVRYEIFQGFSLATTSHSKKFYRCI